MRFGKKNFFNNALYVRLSIVFLAVLAVVLSRAGWERYVAEREVAERRQAVELELAALAIRKAELEGQVEYMAKERGIEEEIRSNFDVAREGEQVAILVGEAPAVETEESETETKKYPWWQFWR